MHAAIKKPLVIPQGHKWCPGCTAVLPVASFGPDKSRPPFYLQGRCRVCVAKANRRGRKPDWPTELAEVISEVDGLPGGRTLVVSFRGGRGRRRIAVHPESAQPAQNWRDMLDGHAANEKAPAEVSFFPERVLSRGQRRADWPENWAAWAAVRKHLCKQTPTDCY